MEETLTAMQIMHSVGLAKHCRQYIEKITIYSELLVHHESRLRSFRHCE